MTTTNNQLPANLQPEGDICIPLFVPDNQEWLWYAVKCLSFPSAKRFWKGHNHQDIETMRREWEARVYLPFVKKVMESTYCAEVSQGDCVEYSARAGFITWFPINPFYDSSIPSGYVQPPFFLWQNILPSIIPDFIENYLVDAIGFTGYQDNDVLTALWCFPFFMNWFNEFSGGFPRFTVNVQGQGSVELHLLNVPLGGRVLITVDVEFNPLDIINGLVNEGFNMIELNKDVFAAPPELETVHIVEIELPDDDTHTIHVTFLPTVNDSFDFINFGGGLRKVVLCGVIPIGETEMNCIDVLDCLDFGENESIAAQSLSNQTIGAATYTPVNFSTTDGSIPHTWLIGAWSKENSGSRYRWQGETAIKVHIAAITQLNSAVASQKRLAIAVNGSIVAQQYENNTVSAFIDIETDVMLEPGDYFEVQAFSATAGNTVAANTGTRMTAHRIDKTGATGAQGQPGIPGNEGSQGTVPPEIEYLFFENIITNTNIFLENLTELYTDSPQDIDADIPTDVPDSSEKAALCKAIAAWVTTYVEAKKARIRGASFLSQAWDAMWDVMRDAYTSITGVIGWNPLEGLFSCVVDNPTALEALSDVDAVTQVICCLSGELNDIALLTTSLPGAINACETSLTGHAHDIICLLQNDLNLEHTLNFYYLYGKALENALNTVCPCVEGQSYIEYDFTVSNHGFTSADGTWVAGQGWVANITEPSTGNYRAEMTITKEFPLTGLIFAGGMVYSAVSNCGIEHRHWLYYLDGIEQGGREIGSIPNGDNLKITYANATSYVPELFDKVSFRVSAADCDGIAPHGKAIIHKARIWLDNTGLTQGVSSVVFPAGLVPSGSGSDEYWQP